MTIAFLVRLSLLIFLASVFGVVGCGQGGSFRADATGQSAVQQTTSSAQTTTDMGSMLTSGPIAFPDGFMTSVKTYGAKGDGTTDDTAAIQAALADGRSSQTEDYFGHPKGLFFPAGTYVVSETLKWIGCCVTIQGTGTNSTVIRLTPNAAGFNDPSNPKPLIITPAGYESFHQNIWDLQIEIGANNAGATALSYVSNNMGSLHDVLIKSDDGNAYSGVDLTRAWAGPLLIRNVEIDGFDVGFDLYGNEYSSTFESITVKNQRVAGIRNVKEAISIRGFRSINQVPALTNSKGFVVLLDGELTGGAAANSALTTNMTMYLRNVSSSGYGTILNDMSKGGAGLITGPINEYLVGSRTSLTGSLSKGSLNLPVEETPNYTDTNLTDMKPFMPRYYGDTSTLQALLNSGASTIYFPFGVYFSHDEVSMTVPATVHRIVGFGSVVFGSAGGYNQGGIQLVVSSNNTDPLIIEQMTGLKVYHQGGRPVVIKDEEVSYTTAPGAGSVFLEDVTLKVPLVVQKGQTAWARQLNDEVAETKIANQGGSLWILGLKTELSGTVINTTSGGTTELLGGLIYPATTVLASNPAFISVDSQVSYMYMQNVYSTSFGYACQVEETRSGTTGRIMANPSARFLMPLFIGFE